MGRAKQSMAPAATSSRRRTTKTGQAGAQTAAEQAAETPAVSASGFDASAFAAPDLYAGDFTSVVTETTDERNTYYGGPDDYYSDEDDWSSSGSGRDYSYQVITGVHLDAASPNDILLTVMRKLEDKPVVAELKANPIFFYGAGRAAQRFAKQLGGVDISYQSEGDYYGDRLSSIDVGPEYEQAFSNFEAEIESMFALSTAGSDDQIIEQGLLAEYGRLLPKLAGKHYVIKRVAVADIVRRRTNTNDSVVGIYSHDRWRQQTMARSARNANARNRRVGLKGSVEADFAALVKAQPQMLVVTNEHGKHDIIDGYHRFKSLATSQLPPTPKHVFVLAAE